MIRFWSVLALFLALGTGPGIADCSALYALAQRHANDMARRHSLDHAGFMKHRGPAGVAAAENVAVGCDTEACARQAWLKFPRHRANMMLGGCEAVPRRCRKAAGAIGSWKSARAAAALAVTFPSTAVMHPKQAGC